jgi:Transposase DDE domain group 1
LSLSTRQSLHTAAYWLLLMVRDAIAKPHPLATAEFTTLRMRLLKIAGRITETATRVRIAFAAACPDAALFRGIAVSFQPAGP